MPGHTPDTLVGFVPEAGVFLGGDAVESPLPFLNEASPIDEWRRELEWWATKLEAIPGRVRVVPSHGPVAGPELLRANARYLSDLLSGTEPTVPADLTPFYQETHQNNLVLARDR
jgi:glyoxylase-like metal-dependent hydrolase (beta-lactamase superfamily II)